MKILALDTSTTVTSVATVVLGDSPETRFRTNTPHKRSDSSAIFEGLQSALITGGHPDAICVGLGPGSYNGLRAGIAAARAMSTALNIPLLALPSPLAIDAPSSGFWAIGDARGGHYWVASIKEGAFFHDPRLMRPDVLIISSSPRRMPPDLQYFRKKPIPV